MSHTRRAAFCLVFALTHSAAAAATGGAGAPPAATDSVAAGAVTRAWLDAQRNGESAAPARSVAGAVASRTYQRYLDSFEHPLPVFFERKASGATPKR